MLHRVSSNRGTKYDDIFQAYTRCVTSHHGGSVVIFDGYTEGPSTKYVTHRQTRTGTSTVHVSGSMLFPGSRDDVLTNTINKQKFIHLLADHLSHSDCYVEHANADADLLIVQNATAAANKVPRCWNMAVMKTVLSPEVCNCMLFVHAILGCDTTSMVLEKDR